MKTTTVAYLKEHLSAVLRRVERGESVLILSRGRPVGRIEPVRPSGDENDADRIARLEKAGVLRPPTESVDWRPIQKASPVRVTRGQSVVDALLEERREGR